MRLQLRRGAGKWEQLTPAKRRTVLRSWMPRLIQDLTNMFQSRQVFLEFIDIIRTNPATLRPPTFVGWVRNNYLNSQAVALRRIVDRDTRSISLLRLMKLLQASPDTVSQSSLRKLFSIKRLPFRWADVSWRKLVGNTPHLPSATIARDIRDLERAFSKVQRLVNKRIAHAGAKGALRKLPQFKDVDHALALANRLLMKYNTLLTGDGLASANATPSYDWRDALTVAWLPVDRRDWPKRKHDEPALAIGT